MGISTIRRFRAIRTIVPASSPGLSYLLCYRWPYSDTHSGLFPRSACDYIVPHAVIVEGQLARWAILTISSAIPSGARMKSTHPLAIADAGMSG
jgi:hypothetical protein